MDRLTYIAMTGAKNMFTQQAAVANNLANANTTGYRAEEHKFRAIPVLGEGAKTRAFAIDASVTTANFDVGPITPTGRDLDVAVQGKGWIAVRAADGSEAYTRNGHLQLNANGQLQTSGGLEVQGDGGAISIPPDNEISIGKDGTISLVASSGSKKNTSSVGRIKLVNPEEETLIRGADGLFRVRDGGEAPLDEKVSVASGFLEGSNVSVVDSMVNMISIARHFETQMKLIQSADANDRAATSLLSISR